MGMKLALLRHNPILDPAWTRFNANNRMARRPAIKVVGRQSCPEADEWIQTTGRITQTNSPASPVVAAMLDRFGTDRSREELGSLFVSNEELELALRHRASEAFGIPVDKVPAWEDE